ncbi:hypothetical protein DFJ74DRAFT_682000 [Hyaloraphidium curvatum]|nr:hypothetical protein DFJ74DRAFT_682000 [Hyaloraphidium curvatum]
MMIGSLRMMLWHMAFGVDIVHAAFDGHPAAPLRRASVHVVKFTGNHVGRDAARTGERRGGERVATSPAPSVGEKDSTCKLCALAVGSRAGRRA